MGCVQWGLGIAFGPKQRYIDPVDIWYATKSVGNSNNNNYGNGCCTSLVKTNANVAAAAVVALNLAFVFCIHMLSWLLLFFGKPLAASYWQGFLARHICILYVLTTPFTAHCFALLMDSTPQLVKLKPIPIKWMESVALTHIHISNYRQHTQTIFERRSVS